MKRIKVRIIVKSGAEFIVDCEAIKTTTNNVGGELNRLEIVNMKSDSEYGILSYINPKEVAAIVVIAEYEEKEVNPNA